MMEFFKKINGGQGVREFLVGELESAGAALRSLEEAGCGSCGACSACDDYGLVPWSELELFFDGPGGSFGGLSEGSVSFFRLAEWVEGSGGAELAGLLLSVPGLFEALEEEGFSGLSWGEKEALLEAVADVVRNGPMGDVERFLWGETWMGNLWLREEFYSRGGSDSRLARLEEEVGKAREVLFFDSVAVGEFSLDDLLSDVYVYGDPDDLYGESPVGGFGDVWEEVLVGGETFVSVLLEVMGREYPFNFSPDALASLASLSGCPGAVLEGVLEGAGVKFLEPDVWPWFYSLNSLWGVVVAALEESGYYGDFARKVFGDDFLAAREEWYYGVLVDWIRSHGVFTGTRMEHVVLMEAAESSFLDVEGARLIIDALPGYWVYPSVYRALAGNVDAPLSVLEELVNDSLDVGVPELEELARGSIARKEEVAG